MRIIGTTVFNAFEGGFWGVLGDDGKKYRPTEWPEAWRQAGLRVVVECERSPGPSIFMWGIAVAVTTVTAAEPAPEGESP